VLIDQILYGTPLKYVELDPIAVDINANTVKIGVG